MPQAHISGASELKDSKPVRKEDDIPRTAPHPVYDKNSAKGLTKDSTDPQYEDGPKHSVRNADTSLKGTGVSSDAATTRKRPRKHLYDTLEKDVVVPPFNDWEKNPESADKYTGVFQIISESRKTPGTPIKNPVEPETKGDSTEGKGCRCLSWLFK